MTILLCDALDLTPTRTERHSVRAVMPSQTDATKTRPYQQHGPLGRPLIGVAGLMGYFFT